MYEKLYHAAKTSTEEQDQQWRSIVSIRNSPPSSSAYTTTPLTTNMTTAHITSTATIATSTLTTATQPLPISNNHNHTATICNHHNHHHHHQGTSNTVKTTDAKKALLRVTDFLSPKDKLVQLCVALNCLTETKQSQLDSSVSNLTAPDQTAQPNFTAADIQQSSSSIIIDLSLIHI